MNPRSTVLIGALLSGLSTIGLAGTTAGDDAQYRARSLLEAAPVARVHTGNVEAEVRAGADAQADARRLLSPDVSSTHPRSGTAAKATRELVRSDAQQSARQLIGSPRA